MNASTDGMRPVVSAPGSHLYRGVVLRMRTPDNGTDPARARLRPADLLFADGSQSTAQVLTDDRGHLVLWVDAYVTTRGTSIPERMWSLTMTTDDPDETTLRLGTRLP